MNAPLAGEWETFGDRKRKVGKALVRAGLSAVILSFLAWKIHWRELAEVIGGMHVGLTVTAFALLHIGQSFSSYRWMLLARPLGFTQPYGTFRRLFYIGTFFNLFLPTSIGGDAVRAVKLAGGKSGWLPALSCVIADRVTGVAAMLLMACLATGVPLGELPVWVLAMPWALLAGLAGAMLLLPQLAARLGKFRLLLDGLDWSSGRRERWWRAVGLSVIVQTFATVQVVLLGLALGLSVPWPSYFVVVPLVTLLTMLPISFNGVGVREGSLVLLLAPYGVSQAQAVTLGLGWLSLSLGVGLVGGVIYLIFDRPAAASTEGTAAPGVVAAPRDFFEGKDSHGSVDHRADEGRAGQRAAAA